MNYFFLKNSKQNFQIQISSCTRSFKIFFYHTQFTMRLTLDQQTWIITNFKVFEYFARLRRAFCIHSEKTRSPLNCTVIRIIIKFKLLESVQNVPRSGHSNTPTNDQKFEKICLFLENIARMSLRRTHLAAAFS